MAWWRHQMEIFSALLTLCAGNSPVTRVFPAKRPVTRSCDVFLICARINGWVNHGEADDMGRHRAHYDVIVRYLDAQASQYNFAVSNITCIPIPYSATCLQYRKWESHNTHYHSMVHQSCHFPRYWPLVSGMHWSSVNSPLTGQWRGAFMFTLICVWIND